MKRLSRRSFGELGIRLGIRIDRNREVRDEERIPAGRTGTFRALARSALAGAARAGAVLAESAVTALIVALFQNL
ncbi:hypothetical protein [Saccharopolyspora sp. NPDC050642]|uniref:hypothetical protein n=1 Tax=Saccharopolyspora sp. NPDC050642 TaxID=3157099 RepID=UPI0033ED6BCA